MIILKIFICVPKKQHIVFCAMHRSDYNILFICILMYFSSSIVLAKNITLN